MKVFYTLLFIGGCLLLCNDIQAQELTCADAESNPSLEDCSSGASETGVPGDGVPDPELTGCLSGEDVVWFAYQFLDEVLMIDFDGGGTAVLFEGATCSSLSELECGGIITIANDPNMTYFVGVEDGETFDLNPITAPSNEDCPGDPLSGTLSDENNGCASAPTGSCGGNHSVWYEVTVGSDGTTLTVEITGGTIADPEINIYDACGGLEVSTAGACSNVVEAACLAEGDYYIEVSSAMPGTFDIEESQMPTGPSEDVCSGALTLGSGTLVCGDVESGSPAGAACPDSEASPGLCLDGVEGIWYTFDTDASLPVFTISGDFELFIGPDCGSLTSLGDCNDSPLTISADASESYWVLMDNNGSFTVETPPMPDNTTCNDATVDIVPSGEVFTNCCSPNGEIWYVLSSEGAARLLSATNISIGSSLQIDVFDSDCSTILFSANGDFTDEAIPSCSINPRFVRVMSDVADCGEIELSATVEQPQCPVDPQTCEDALALSPTTGGAPECESTCNLYFCENACGEQSFWFTVFTDVDASEMTISVSAGGDFEPMVQVLQGDCSGTGQQGVLLPCTDGDEFTLAVNGNVEYFIEVSNAPGSGVPGDFTFCVSTSVASAQCAVGSLVSSRPNSDGSGPPEGPFCAGEKVQFDYSVTFTSDPLGMGNNCQWLQGIIPSLGPGWDLDACSIESQTPGGGWEFFPEGDVLSQVNSALLGLQPSPHGGNELIFGPGGLSIGDAIPQGWYFTSPGGAGCANTGNPNTEWGMPQGCGSVITVNITFFLQVRDDIDLNQCMDPEYLKVHVFTMADGMTGCWVNNACSEDAPAIENYEVACDGLPEVCDEVELQVCSGDMLNIPLEICDGRDADIMVMISEDSSTEIDGMTEGSVGGFGFIDDELENTSCSIQDAIYEIYAMDAETGCRGPAIEIVVTVFPELEIGFNQEIGELFCPGENLKLATENMCGTPPYTYQWDTGATTDCIDLPHEQFLPPGDQRVSVIVTDDNGCSLELDFEYETSQQLNLEIAGPPSVCIGDGPDNPEYCVRHEVPVFQLDYDWTVDPPVGLEFDVQDGDTCIVVMDELSTPGAYNMTVQIVDELSCVYDTTFQILVDNGPALSLTTGMCTGDEITLIGQNTNANVMATNMHIVQIDNTVTPNTVDTLIGPLQTDSLGVVVSDFSGIFELRGASAGGCQSSVPLVLPPLPSPDVFVSPPSLCAGQTVTLTLNNPGDFTSFIWTAGTMTFNSAVITDTPASSTTYTFMGTDLNGCDVIESHEVVVNAIPDVNISGSSTVCNGGTTDLIANVTGGEMPFDFNWSDGSMSTSITVSPTTPTTYTVNVSDANNCMNSANFEVSPASELTPVATAPSFCEGDMTTISAGAFDMYMWRDPNDMPISGGGQTIDVSVPGTYSLTVTDVTGCTGATTVEVVEISRLPNVLTDVSATLCNDTGGTDPTSINLDALVESGIQGFWRDNNDNNISATSNDFSVVGLPAGTYDFSFVTTNATDPCPNETVTFQLIVNNCGCPSVAVGSLPDYCASDNNTAFDLSQIQFTTESGEWAIDRATDIDISGDQILVNANTPPGTYTLVYTLTTTPPAPCSAMSMPVTFEVFQQPFAALDPNSVSRCNSNATGEATDIDLNALIASGDNTGTWSHDGAGPAVNGTMVDFDGVVLGDYVYEYTLDVEAGSPCMPLQLMTTIRVIDCNCPDISIMPLDDLCTTGTTINLNGFLVNPSGEQGQWSVTDSNGMPVPASSLVGDRFESNGLAPGIYTVSYALITPIAGCDLVNTVSQDITINDEPEASLTTASISVCNAEETDNLPFMVDLDTLLASGSGDWSVSASFPGVFDANENIIDFTGVPPDAYEVVFTTNNALAPCDQVDIPLEVDVRACGCPMFLFTTPGEFCTTDGVIDLDQFITNITSLPDGEWVIVSGSSPPNINGSMVNLTSYVTGPYEYQYRLENVPMGCTVRTHNVVINVLQAVSVEVESLISPCNVFQSDGSHCINLNDFVVITGGTGTWEADPFYVADGGDDSDITNICFDGLPLNTSYTFSFTAVDDNGMCDPVVERSIIITRDCSCPNVDLASPNALCQGETLDLSTLEGGLTADGVWSAEQGGASITLQNTVLETAGLEGVIDLIFTPSGAFDPTCDLGMVSVEVFVPQSAGTATPVEFCSGEEVVVDLFGQLTGASVGGVWTEASTNPNQTGFDDIAGTFNTAGQRSGIYEFMYTAPEAGTCPPDEEVVSVNLLFNPVADAGDGGVITCNASVEIGGTDTSTGGDFTYLWTATDGGSLTVDDQPLVMVSQAGTYTLIVTDMDGCTAQDMVVVTSDGGLTAGVDITEPNCPSDFGQAVVTTTNGAGVVLFSLDGGEFQESDMFGNLPAGPHTIVVTDDNGCEIMLDFVIPEPEVLDVDSGEDRQVELGDSLYILNAAISTNIDPETIVSVTWVDAGSGEEICSGPLSLCGQIEVDPEIFNEYCVTIVNEDGCEATDCVILREQLIRDVYIPTIFDANADNPVDQSFFVQADRFVEAVEEMRIYDRWGQLVYSIPTEVLPNDPSVGWNGRWGNTGGLLNQGVYVYFIKVRFSSFQGLPDTEIFAGDITLIR